VQAILERDDIELDADGLLAQLFARATMENCASVLSIVVFVSNWIVDNRPDRPHSRSWDIFWAHQERLLADVTPFFLRIVADLCLPVEAVVPDDLSESLLELVRQACGQFPIESAMVAASLFTKDPQLWAEVFESGLEFLVSAALEDRHACLFLDLLLRRLKGAAAVCLRRFYPEVVRWALAERPGQRIFQRLPLLLTESLIRYEPDPSALEAIRHSIVSSFLDDSSGDIVLDDIEMIAGSLSVPDGTSLAQFVARTMSLKDALTAASLPSLLSIMGKIAKNLRRHGGEAECVAGHWLDSLGKKLLGVLEVPDIGSRADELAKGLFEWARILRHQNHPAVHRFVVLVHAKLNETFETWASDAFTFFEVLLQTPEFIPELEEIGIIAKWVNLAQGAEGLPLRLRVACHDVTAVLVKHNPGAVWGMVESLINEWDANIGTRSSLSLAFISLLAQVGCEVPFQDEQRVIDILDMFPPAITGKTLSYAAESLAGFVRRIADIFPGCAFHAAQVIVRVLIAHVWIPPSDGIPLVSPVSDDLRRLLVETCTTFIAASEERRLAFQAMWQDQPRKWANVLCLFGW
jgi:hypothetical protein